MPLETRRRTCARALSKVHLSHPLQKIAVSVAVLLRRAFEAPPEDGGNAPGEGRPRGEHSSGRSPGFRKIVTRPRSVKSSRLVPSLFKLCSVPRSRR